MEPLQLNRELLTYICACSPPKNTPWSIKLRRHIIVIIMIILLMFGWISSVVFIIKYVKVDLRNALYAIFQIAAEFSASYTLLTAYIQPGSSLTVFLKFKNIRENCKIFSTFEVFRLLLNQLLLFFISK